MAAILVYHTGALGDFITLLPALALLRRLDPGSRILLLGRPAHGELARAHGLVDVVVDAAQARYRSFHAPPLHADALRILEGVDRALLVTASATMASALRAVIPAVDAQPPLPSAPIGMYEYHARFVLRAFGEPPGGPEALRAVLSAPTLATGDDGRLPRTIWLHPGAGSPAKCWPAARFGEAARGLRVSGWRLTWSFGPADEALRDNPELAMGPGDMVSRDETPLELARGLRRAWCYVGSDTGVTHLAAAAGCRVVAIFGPTDPLIWRPRGYARVLVRRDSCEPGCAVAGCVRLRDGAPACLREITAADAVAAVEELAATPPTR